MKALRQRVLELEKRVYGYDHETDVPLPPNRPKPLP
jgi:hypothetical protein